MTVLHTQYPDFANPELLEKIPLTARTVLDVGCAQGALGANYLRRNPNCRFLGIERDAEAATLAQTRLSEVFVGDVEATPMPFEVPDGIDCIIYGDVLGHLVDPWALLKEHARYLAPHGTVLVCTPNIEHWSFVARLLKGNFDYEDSGLLDRGHLRWFTPRTMAQALTDAGLTLSDAAPRPVAQGQGEAFVKALAPSLQALNIDPQDYWQRSNALQVIWRAHKTGQELLEVASTMLAPQGGVSDVRVLEPMRALRTQGGVFSHVAPEQDLHPLLGDIPRIAILHRPLLLAENGLERVRGLLQQGYVVVSEFDDHPSFMAKRGVELGELLTFKGVHAVQTSTSVLAQTLAQDNPEVAVFPNAIFELPPVQNFQDMSHLTVFFGALNRKHDWAPFMPVLNEVARAVGERLRFRVLFDEEFYEALETPHKSFEPALLDYASYMRELSAAEICFMPLLDTEFNRAKSDLKFIESASARVCALASDVVYKSVIQDGQTGMLFHDAPSLRSALLRLLAYPETTRRIADAGRAYVAQHRMAAYQVDARVAWYRSLWDRRDELNEALKARVPELFS